MKDFEDQRIWIIGASSGIGRAVAEELNSRGAHLILSARTEGALKEIASSAAGPTLIAPLDTRDPGAIEKCFQSVVEQTAIDIFIYMAGTYAPAKISELNPMDISDTLTTNLQGAILTVRQILPYFLKRKKGQIVLCGSVAGYRGLPNGQPYGASKAGLINFAESLRAECSSTPIDVKLINPGFVRTRLTDKNNFSMPAIIEPMQAAKIIVDGLKGKYFEIHFPKKFTWAVKLLALLPYWLYFRVVGR